MLLLDMAGNSDPFAIVSIGNHSVQSKVIKNTANPNWNEILSISKVDLYGTLEEIRVNIPEITVNIYDEDEIYIYHVLLIELKKINNG